MEVNWPWNVSPDLSFELCLQEDEARRSAEEEVQREAEKRLAELQQKMEAEKER